MLQNGSGGSEHLMDAEEIKEMRRRAEKMLEECRRYPLDPGAQMGEADCRVEIRLLDRMLKKTEGGENGNGAL